MNGLSLRALPFWDKGFLDLIIDGEEKIRKVEVVVGFLVLNHGITGLSQDRV